MYRNQNQQTIRPGTKPNKQLNWNQKLQNHQHNFRKKWCWVPDISAIGTVRSGRRIKRKTTMWLKTFLGNLSCYRNSCSRKFCLDSLYRQSHECRTSVLQELGMRFDATYQASSARSKKISEGWSVDSSMCHQVLVRKIGLRAGDFRHNNPTLGISGILLRLCLVHLPNLT